MVDKRGQQILQELELIMWPVIIDGFGICYVEGLCVLSHYLNPVVEIWFILSGNKKMYKKEKREDQEGSEVAATPAKKQICLLRHIIRGCISGGNWVHKT